MNFDIVKRQIEQEYIKIYGDTRQDDIWSLEICVEIFNYYYQRYYETFGVNHPHLSNKSVSHIILNLPYCDSEYHGECYDLEPEDYPPIIDAYFKQHFSYCNYSISHFMSGEIRMLRFYETLY